MELRHIATRNGRLSSFLKNEMAMSTGLINRLKWQNAICVNGRSEHNDFAVTSGDIITVLLDEPAPEYPAEPGELTVLYEDEHLLAVDKPAGMLIHPSRSCITGTLANRVAGYYQKTRQSSAFHPVTRLDRDTYGIVLLAKNSHMHMLLQNTPIRKTYHAITFGAPPLDSGRIDAPIARRPLPSLLREIREDGKPSLTEYTVLSRDGSCAKLALRPITGRTHQLRLHCTHIGCPILGDPQYGSPRSMAHSQALGLQSQLLCAVSLEFSHPITGEPLFLRSHMDAAIDP